MELLGGLTTLSIAQRTLQTELELHVGVEAEQKLSGSLEKLPLSRRTLEAELRLPVWMTEVHRLQIYI